MNNSYLIYLPAGILIVITIVVMLLNVRRTNKLISSITKKFETPPQDTDYSLDSIDMYHKYVEIFGNTNKHIDNITWNDLNMNSVYKRINNCQTSVGEEYLYQQLHEPLIDKTTKEKRQKLLLLFEKNTEFRLRVQLILNKLGIKNYNKLSLLIFNPKTTTFERRNVYMVLAFSVIALILATIIGYIMSFSYTSIFLVLTIINIFVNVYTHYSNQIKIANELSAIKYFSKILRTYSKLKKQDTAILEEIFPKTKEDLATFKPVISARNIVVAEQTGDFAFVAEYLNMIFLNELRRFNSILKLIINNIDAFHRIYKYVGEIDMAVNTLSFRQSLSHYCEPQLHENKGIFFKDLYHPLIKDSILNDGNLNNNILITGPNASGKSTFIKALAVNNILAQTIFTCTANEYIMRPSLVITSMAIRDDIEGGESYYIVEIKSLKRILDRIKELPCTCFIDEILRGTNTVERISASIAVLKHLHVSNCQCMVATHDVELAQLLEDNYNNYHFEEDVTSDSVNFDYKLKEGVTQSNNAIKLLSFMGFDNKIVDEANFRVKEYLSKGTWEK